jgi:hypothetical protein
MLSKAARLPARIPTPFRKLGIQLDSGATFIPAGNYEVPPTSSLTVSDHLAGLHPDLLLLVSTNWVLIQNV